MQNSLNTKARILFPIVVTVITLAVGLLTGCQSGPTSRYSAAANGLRDDRWRMDLSSLGGTIWEFKPEGGDWQPIQVPAGGWRAQNYKCDAGTYRAWLAIPKNIDGRRVRLTFDAINFGADIFVGQDASNLVAVAHHIDGWVPVTADITAFATPGSRVLVQVNVAGRKKFRVKGKYIVPEGATWDPALEDGILRGVHLDLLPAVRVEDVFIRTHVAPDLLNAAVTVVNDSDQAAAVTLVSKLKSANRVRFKYPAIPDTTVTVPAHHTQTVELGDISWPI